MKWKPIRSLGEQFKDESIFRETDCHILRWAKFDIDNDGQSESVVKRSGCLGGILSDRLYIFQSEDPRKDIYQTFMKPMTNSLVGMIDYTGDTYELKELLPFNWKPGRQRLHHVSGIVFVHPFTFNGVTYLDLHGLCCNEDQSAWHIIARYKEAKEELRTVGRHLLRSSAEGLAQNRRGKATWHSLTCIPTGHGARTLLTATIL